MSATIIVSKGMCELSAGLVGELIRLGFVPSVRCEGAWDHPKAFVRVMRNDNQLDVYLFTDKWLALKGEMTFSQSIPWSIPLAAIEAVL